MCEKIGKPEIKRKMAQKGFLLVSGTANSFGMRYIEPGAFEWMEMADIYRRSPYVRLSRLASGEVTTQQITEPAAEVEVNEAFRDEAEGVSVSTTVIRVRSTGEVLAEASRATFSGGRTKWVLGAWGSASCPSGMNEGEEFRQYYKLVELTLAK